MSVLTQLSKGPLSRTIASSRTLPSAISPCNDVNTDAKALASREAAVTSFGASKVPSMREYREVDA